MIVRARWVVTMDGPPIEDGAVVIRGNKIEDTGRWQDLRAAEAKTVIDLGEHALLPGLINAHCHLDYTAFRGTIPPQQSFTAWIRAINGHKAECNEADYLAAIAAGFDEAVAFGTTTIANLEAFPQLLRQINDPPVRTWWLAEMIDVREPQSAAAIARGNGGFLRRSRAIGLVASDSRRMRLSPRPRRFMPKRLRSRSVSICRLQPISRNHGRRWRCSIKVAGNCSTSWRTSAVR